MKGERAKKVLDLERTPGITLISVKSHAHAGLDPTDSKKPVHAEVKKGLTVQGTSAAKAKTDVKQWIMKG